MKICLFPDCGRPHHARALCTAHWHQWNTTGGIWAIGSRVNRKGSGPWRGTRNEIAAEAEWLADSGETADRAAARLGYTDRRSLYRALNRAGRLDVWEKLNGRVAVNAHS